MEWRGLCCTVCNLINHMELYIGAATFIGDEWQRRSFIQLRQDHLRDIIGGGQALGGPRPRHLVAKRVCPFEMRETIPFRPELGPWRLLTFNFFKRKPGIIRRTGTIMQGGRKGSLQIGGCQASCSPGAIHRSRCGVNTFRVHA